MLVEELKQLVDIPGIKHECLHRMTPMFSAVSSPVRNDSHIVVWMGGWAVSRRLFWWRCLHRVALGGGGLCSQFCWWFLVGGLGCGVLVLFRWCIGGVLAGVDGGTGGKAPMGR